LRIPRLPFRLVGVPRVAHRKQVKHYDIAGHAHELTFSTHQRRPLLTDPERIRIVLDAIARACPRLGFRVLT